MEHHMHSVPDAVHWEQFVHTTGLVRASTMVSM